MPRSHATATDPRPVDQQIFDSVRDAVMDQRLRPGMRLPEEQLCEVFSVSRTIVRKALQQLAHARIVELRPNRGAVIYAPTPAETHDVFAARRVIEAAILPLVVARAGKRDLAQLRAMLKAEHEALAHDQHGAWVRMAGDFHLQLARLGGNSVLESFLVELLSRCSLIVAMYEAPGDAHCEHDEHAALVEHIAQGRCDEACALMSQHLQALEDRLSPRGDTQAPDLAALLAH